jgi:hypothetical protein
MATPQAKTPKEDAPALYVARAFYAVGQVQAVGSAFAYTLPADRELVSQLKAANKLTAQPPAPEFPPVDPDAKGGENNPLTEADAAADLAGQPRPESPAEAPAKPAKAKA